jgi:superfamily II DNA or RNA helicase
MKEISFISTITSNKGYSISKKDLGIDRLNNLKKELTVTAKFNPNFAIPEAISNYEERNNWIRVPKWWGITNFGLPKKDHQSTRKVEFKFIGQVRENQMDFRSEIINGLENNSGGIINIATGSGKTVLLLNILEHLQERAVILVHKGLLAEQWKQEIDKFLPGARIGIIQGKNKNFSEVYDITIVMLQTLQNIEIVPDIFGVTVFDECHHLSARTFSKTLFKINSKYNIGLSATIDRADGLRCVLEWHLGPVLCSQKPDRSNQIQTEVKIYRTNITIPEIDHTKNFVGYSTALQQNEERNSLIFKIIKKLITEDTINERKILILTSTIEHVKLLYETINTFQSDKTVGFFLANVKKETRESEKEKDIICATYSMFSEGVSISKLNTILFAAPKREITQALGRIYRQVHSINPLVIDISDPVFLGQEKGRISIYKKELGKNFCLKYENL